MPNHRKNPRPQASADLAGVTHAAWKAAHAAGLTRFGRATQASRPMGEHRTRAAHDRRACRGRHSAEE